MAHELTKVEGEAQMFSVIQTPWHREGKVLIEAPNYDEAIRLAGLGFEVEKFPTFINMPITADQQAVADITGEAATPEQYESKNAFVVCRTDNMAELGAVGPKYVPIQNSDMFRTIEPLLDSGVFMLETGGSLREGADVWSRTCWSRTTTPAGAQPP